MSIHEQIKASKNIVYQDAEILIVLDIDPISKGHALILPQKHYKDIDELPIKLLTKIVRAAQKYSELLKEEFSPQGCSIMQNGGVFNDIDVFHLHVFPRFDGCEFGQVFKLNTQAQKVFEELETKLRKELEK